MADPGEFAKARPCWFAFAEARHVQHCCSCAMPRLVREMSGASSEGGMAAPKTKS